MSRKLGLRTVGGLTLLVLLTVSLLGVSAKSVAGSGKLDFVPVELILLRTSNGIASNHPTFRLPKRVVSYKRESLAELASVIASLPAQSKRVFSCPIDFGVEYQLTFKSRRGLEQIYEFDPGGCEVLYRGPRHDNPLRIDDAFWSALGTSLGIKGAQQSLFAGVLAPAS